MTSSITLRSRIAGTKLGPIPWILCGPGCPSLRTGESFGSTAMICTSGLRSLSTCPTPVIVPPVPTPAMKMSTLPSVSRQISSAVVLRWISGFASFSNCLAQIAPGVSATICFAMLTASDMPLVGSVRINSAPKARSSVRRSLDIDAGIVRITL